MGRTLAHSLNVDLKDAGKKMGSIPVVPSVMKFQLKSAPPWEDEQWDDGTVKWYEIIEIGDKHAKVREVTGKCNDRGMNTTNVMAQCSTTSGQEFTISGQQFDWLMAHVSGQGGMGGMGMGGPMGGGMGGMPPPPPPGGGMGGMPPPAPTGAI